MNDTAEVGEMGATPYDEAQGVGTVPFLAAAPANAPQGQATADGTNNTIIKTTRGPRFRFPGCDFSVEANGAVMLTREKSVNGIRRSLAVAAYAPGTWSWVLLEGQEVNRGVPSPDEERAAADRELEEI